MLYRSSIALAAFVLLDQASAFNSHRHLHQKRYLEVVTDVVIDIVTVTVTDGLVPPPATPTSTLTSSTTSLSSTTTSTLSPVIEPSPLPVTVVTSAAVVSEPVAVVTPTTFSTISPPAPAKPVVANPEVNPVVAENNLPTPTSAPVEPAAPSPSTIPPTPTPTLQQPAPAPPQAMPSTNSKRGIVYGKASYIDAFFQPSTYCDKCDWAYNWDSSPSGLDRKIEFCPMLWCPDSNHIPDWDSNVKAQIAAGASNILSFNEPDNSGQCVMSPAQAAAKHVQYMNPYANQVRIGSPAITNSGAANQGVDWLNQWVAECNIVGCHYDFCVTHWYATANAVDYLFTHLQAVSDACGGKPVWLTEFAPDGNDGEIVEFLGQALPRLDSAPHVERYAYFMAAIGLLLDTPTTLGTYGKVYATT